MKYVLAGCTGFIGKALLRAIINEGHEIVVLTRNPSSLPKDIANGVTAMYWNGKSMTAEWGQHLIGADVLINLSGTPILKYWSKAYKKQLWNSRILSTGALVDALKEYKVTPKVFINASAIGYFQNRINSKTSPFDEAAKPGQGFLSDLCQAWEKEAEKAKSLGIRTVTARLGIVLGNDGGALPQLRMLLKNYLGHTLGEGTQAQPWIHIEDVIEAIKFCIENENAQGVVHLVSPQVKPSSHERFMQIYAELLRRPLWFKLPMKLIRLLLAEFSDALLTTPYVTSKKLQSWGFEFKYLTLTDALKNLEGIDDKKN